VKDGWSSRIDSLDELGVRLELRGINYRSADGEIHGRILRTYIQAQEDDWQNWLFQNNPLRTHQKSLYHEFYIDANKEMPIFGKC
jgi:hypothetical protein